MLRFANFIHKKLLYQILIFIYILMREIYIVIKENAINK